MILRVNKNFNTLKGIVTIPADKSVSHRAVIFSSLAQGKSIIKNFSDGADPHSSLEICKQLGADINIDSSTITIVSDGKLKATSQPLFCGNSGTTMRLMAGILSGQNFDSTLTGDESLSKRPMKRIIEPLSQMGAKITSNDYRAPLEIKNSNLKAITYDLPIASAQVKSCVLLAGLFSDGTTTVNEICPSRNHTEIMLKHMDANINYSNNQISISKSNLSPLNIEIIGDISSAAYFITAGLLVPNSEIILKNVGLNPTRAGILDVAQKMGANIEILDKKEICSEPVGDLKIKYTPNLQGCEISGELIPKLIDEIPIIAVLATQAQGQTVIKDAQDLRNKESDRIKTTVTELKKLGAQIEETQDGMIIQGKTKLAGGICTDSYKDHRLAMSLYIAGLITDKEISVNDFEWVNISFPTFEKLITELYFQ